MTKRRKRLFLLLTAAVVLSVLSLPPVHWRLIGWARSEPFYQGRPASYWAAELRAMQVYSVQFQVAVGPGQVVTYPVWYGWRLVDPRPVAWAKDKLGWPLHLYRVDQEELPFARPDPPAMPVLRALSTDPDEGVSGWAKYVLAKFGTDAPTEDPDRHSRRPSDASKPAAHQAGRLP